jgi:hypothetical protein
MTTHEAEAFRSVVLFKKRTKNISSARLTGIDQKARYYPETFQEPYCSFLKKNQ